MEPGRDSERTKKLQRATLGENIVDTTVVTMSPHLLEPKVRAELQHLTKQGDLESSARVLAAEVLLDDAVVRHEEVLKSTTNSIGEHLSPAHERIASASRQKVLEAQRVFEELTSESSTSDVKEFTRLTGACGGGGANASFRGLALFADGASR